ncbi:hypothetical protein, partial [Sandarakinorhabdus sp.]|uniref:hypothetical protein n=1 Tax=Sandarakinorhabdus sp. TaxID=1916663 RepID=UPI00286DDC9B
AWSASEPGSMYTLEEAGRADFADAVVIWEGKALSHDLLISREGAYYYRVTASLDSNISLPDVTGVQALASLWEQAESYDNRTLLSVQQALIRTAAAIGDQLALLALPVQYGAGDVAAHVDALAAPFLAEPRPLSFAALFHPWPVAMGDDGAVAVPPEGAVAGSHAVRARRRGAWIAAAGQPLADIVALSPALASSDAEALAMNRLNRLHQTPDGFVVSDVFTLSPEHDWRWINVRRLVSLLRRVTVRQGAAFVFEPNGDTLRRAIERIFGHMLADLGRRGAFAGSGGDDSWRLAVDADARSQDDGRLVIEIGIAPAQPLRFLTLVLTQQGARFGVAEER